MLDNCLPFSVDAVVLCCLASSWGEGASGIGTMDGAGRNGCQESMGIILIVYIAVMDASLLILQLHGGSCGVVYILIKVFHVFWHWITLCCS